jgi:hypothetical protein
MHGGVFGLDARMCNITARINHGLRSADILDRVRRDT